MSLYDIRKLFIKDFTGRYDLVVPGSDYSNAGADDYINAGQRWLDRKVSHKKSPASVFIEAPINSFFVTFQEARAVREVWVSITNVGRWELEKLTLRESREFFPLDYSMLVSSRPTWYVPTNFRHPVISPGEITVDQIGNVIYSTPGEVEDFNGIIFYPPTDQLLLVEVIGLFFTPKLEKDTDRSYWTENEPMLLVQAAARMHEVSLRNQQGVRDYETAIADSLLDLEKDEVEEEIATIDQMRG